MRGFVALLASTDSSSTGGVLFDGSIQEPTVASFTSMEISSSDRGKKDAMTARAEGVAGFPQVGNFRPLLAVRAWLFHHTLFTCLVRGGGNHTESTLKNQNES